MPSRVLHQLHDAMQSYVCKWLSGQGFYVMGLPYHDILSEDLQKILARSYTPTALYLRSRADRFAIHKEKECEFEVEIKTIPTNKGGKTRLNLAVEAYPFALSVALAKSGVRKLYVSYHEESKRHFGFWLHELPFIEKLIVPPRSAYSAETLAYIVSACYHHLGRIHTTSQRVKGSGDPYLLIPIDADLPDWRDLVIDHLYQCPFREE